MMLSDPTLRVWLYQRPTDMRKSFRGLIALVKQPLHEDPLSGQLFVFINRRKTYIKVLYYSQGGFCLWMKKLTQGQFALNEHGRLKQALSWHELQWLIEGIEIQQARYRKRYTLARLEAQSGLQSSL